MNEGDAIQVDVDAILTERLGWRRKLVPAFLVRRLENLIHQKRMNEIMKRIHPRRGADFCRAALQELDVRIDVQGVRNLPQNGRVLFAGNHPLGGLDGIATIMMLADHYGIEPLFIVNDLLMAIEPLRDVFVPVNKHGAQNRFTISSLEGALASDKPVVIYPAGLVSRLGKDSGISDLKWHKSFVSMALASHRDIVPLYFEGQNSMNFYKLARWRERLGFRFNFEMLLLPDEMFKGAGKTYVLRCGAPISWAEINREPDPDLWCARIRREVYSLANSHEYGS